MNGSTWAKRACLTAVAATLVLGTGTPAALAAPTKPPVPAGEKVLWTDGTATVTVPDLAAQSPKAWYASHRATLGSARMANVGDCIYSNGYAWGPIGSQSFFVDGQSCISTDCGLWSCTSHFANNHAYYYYLNFTPVTQINPSMKWWVGGINVSVSLPPSFGFSSSNGSDILWAPGPVNDYWFAGLHYDSAVNISATYIYNSYYTAQADFLLSNQWYHLQGD